MRRNRLSACVFGLVLCLSLGCGSLPIPRVAVPGTTITIPMPSWFNPGFGRVLNEEVRSSPGVPVNPQVDYAPPYGPGSELEDEQRGEMLFALHATNDPSSGFVSYLPLRRIIRVQLDEGSRAATPAPGETAATSGTDYRVGQVLALVDIPAGLGVEGPTPYWIFAERWKRAESPPHHFVQDQPMTKGASGSVAWRGWGTWNPQGGIPITIVPAAVGESFNPFEGWNNWFGSYGLGNQVDGDLDNLVPRPKVRLWVKNLDTQEFPAAWEIEVEYPQGKAEILGVEMTRHHKSGGFVAWQPLAEGSFRVVMMDPERKTPSVTIIYRLRDFGSFGRMGPGEFAIGAGAFKSYDEDGAPFPAWAWIDNSWSFW